MNGEVEWKGPLKPYYRVRAELTVAEGLLMRGSRMVIPTSMRAEILRENPQWTSRYDEVPIEGKSLSMVAQNQERYRRKSVQVSHMLQNASSTP